MKESNPREAHQICYDNEDAIGVPNNLSLVPYADDGPQHYYYYRVYDGQEIQ